MFELKPAVWIIAGLVLAALEIVVPGFVIIWFGVAGVITGVLAIFVRNPYIQFGVLAFGLLLAQVWELARSGR